MRGRYRQSEFRWFAVVHQWLAATTNVAYCRGARDEGDTGMGLGVGTTDGCGDPKNFAFSSATADFTRLISRAIWS